MTIRAHSTEDSKHELEFELFSNSGVVRRHKFHYADCEIMNADFDDETASYLKADPKVFTQLLVRIPFLFPNNPFQFLCSLLSLVIDSSGSFSSKSRVVH